MPDTRDHVTGPLTVHQIVSCGLSRIIGAISWITTRTQAEKNTDIEKRSFAVAVVVLAISMLACGPVTPSSPTPFRPPATITPASTTAGTVPPTEPAISNWLPDGTFALYASGPWESPRLYALTPGPASVDLGRTLSYQAGASRTGLWIAHPNSAPPASSMVITNLADGTSYTIPVTSGFESYGAAFDRVEARLAFLEVGPFGAGGTAWAIVVVNLADGSTTRFDTVMTPDAAILPGRPIGWTASGDDLLLDTFMPGTEGNWAGVWAIGLGPGAASTSIDSLASRELVPTGNYLGAPRLSPGATHLLYLNRDFSYTPAGYEVMAYDLAVNQLWQVDVASGSQTSLEIVTDGGALARTAAWSQEVHHVLFAQGNYAGASFASLSLKRRDDAGVVSDAGSPPVPARGDLRSLDWCRPDYALAVVTTADYTNQLHVVELAGGNTLITTADHISVLACISPP
jgi:hypothetical protein